MNYYIQTMTEEQLFKLVLAYFRDKYPQYELDIIDKGFGECVSVKNELQFNTKDFNLLYNLKRLCDLLNTELR